MDRLPRCHRRAQKNYRHSRRRRATHQTVVSLASTRAGRQMCAHECVCVRLARNGFHQSPSPSPSHPILGAPCRARVALERKSRRRDAENLIWQRQRKKKKKNALRNSNICRKTLAVISSATRTRWRPTAANAVERRLMHLTCPHLSQPLSTTTACRTTTTTTTMCWFHRRRHSTTTAVSSLLSALLPPMLPRPLLPPLFPLRPARPFKKS